MMNISKKQYIRGFLYIVALLFVVRLIFPSLVEPAKLPANAPTTGEKMTPTVNDREEVVVSKEGLDAGFAKRKPTEFFNTSDSSLLRHKILSVASFKGAFPDGNDTQLVAANRYGISVTENLAQARKATDMLVYVGANPMFDVDKLSNSIPYLVPRASALLQEIATSFCDSLLIKGMPLHKIIVTSVLRTREDVERLQRRNSNATTNSCHLYGTTFDICYNRYNAVDPSRQTRNDSLKWVLSEVLDDLRQQGRCFVKYEIRQGCFHITTR